MIQVPFVYSLFRPATTRHHTILHNRDSLCQARGSAPSRRLSLHTFPLPELPTTTVRVMVQRSWDKAWYLGPERKWEVGRGECVCFVTTKNVVIKNSSEGLTRRNAVADEEDSGIKISLALTYFHALGISHASIACMHACACQAPHANASWRSFFFIRWCDVVMIQ